MNCKVAVTGIGVLSPLGIELKDHVRALESGQCGTNFKTGFRALFPECCGKIPDFAVKDYIENRKIVKIMSRKAVLGYVAAELSVRDSGIQNQDIISDEENAIIFGNGRSEGITNIKDAIIPSITSEGNIDYDYLGRKGYRMIPPLWIVQRLPNTAAGQISIRHSLKGLNYTVVDESAAGAVSIGEAFICVKDGRSKRAFCGASEGEIFPDYFWRMKKFGIASDSENASKAFDINSDGVTLSEGSATLILEDENSVISRNGKIHGRILSYTNYYIPGFKTDSTRQISLNYIKSMKKAVEDAGININDLNFVQASACGIEKIDRAEALAVKELFGKKVPVTSSNSSTGYPLAASGPISISYALLQMENGFIAPITRTENFYDDNEINYITGSPVYQDMKYCLVNCFDYSGGVSSFVLERGKIDNA
ncbi:MAG TPA: beta-ketoacyl synthase N-terminal-like domain-containing protein [Ruminiclostridium sp.]|nr:beta-ketoacyl synthase N-terminal-like domain-containing protein [Ruminiclostridium sp.]